MLLNLLHEQPEDLDYLIILNPKEIFYHDVSPEQAQPWVDRMAHQSSPSFTSTVDSVAWENVPCTYLMCMQDNGVYPWLQEKMLEGVRKEPKHHWIVEKCDSSHSAWLTSVSSVVRLIRKSAGEKVG